MGIVKSNSFGGRGTESELKKIKRRLSDSELEKFKNIHMIKNAILSHKKELEDNLKNLEGQKEQLEELKKLINAGVNLREKRKISNEQEEEDKKRLDDEIKEVDKNVEFMLGTIIKRNGTRLSKEELNFIKNIKESKDIEYKVATINTILNVKIEEKSYVERYIEDYGNLYNSTEDMMVLKNTYTALRLSEHSLEKIKKDKELFYSICKQGKIDTIYPEYNYGGGLIRKNNFTDLYNNIKKSKNKYVKLLAIIAECGKKKESNFEKYFKDNSDSILLEIDTGIKNLNEIDIIKKADGKQGVEELDKLKDLRNELSKKWENTKKDKRLESWEDDKEDLKNLVNKFNDARNKFYDDFKMDRKAYKHICKIEEMQTGLDKINTFALEIKNRIDFMIRDNERIIGIKLNDELSTKKYVDQDLDNVKESTNTNIHISGDKKKKTLKERLINIKGNLKKTLKFVMALLTGKVSFTTLKLKGSLTKVKGLQRSSSKELKRVSSIEKKRVSKEVPNKEQNKDMDGLGM